MFVYFKPVSRFKNRSGVSEVWSFDVGQHEQGSSW